GVLSGRVIGNVLNNVISEDHRSSRGIIFDEAPGSSALNNNIWGSGPEDNQDGIIVSNSPATTLTRNNITRVRRGINVFGNGNSSFNTNIVMDVLRGLILNCSSNNKLISNTVSDLSPVNNSAGVQLAACRTESDAAAGSDNNLLNGNKLNGLC